jgi:hypothetical protein
MKQSLFVSIYFLDDPYSGEVRVRVEPKEGFPHSFRTELAFIWQRKIIAGLGHNFLVKIIHSAKA